MKIEVEIDKTNICDFINPKYIGADLVEEAWQICEDNKNNEDVYYPIMEKLMALNDTYLETWDEWIVPELDDRRQKNKHVSYELVLYLISNWGPGLRKWNIRDTIEHKFMEGMGYNNFNEIPAEILKFIYNEYGLPKEWHSILEIKHFRDELIEFTDSNYLQETLNKYSSEISNISDLQEILINLASENEGSKVKNNLDLFLQIIEDCAPYENMFSSKRKAWITEIINEGYWDEEEIEIIQGKFYDIDFDIPYRMIEDQRIHDEAAHIKKMTDLNPLYRHD